MIDLSMKQLCKPQDCAGMAQRKAGKRTIHYAADEMAVLS
jgi:hypothetical protein